MGFFDSIKDIYDDIEDEIKRTASGMEAEWNRSSDLERALIIGGAVAAPIAISSLGASAATTTASGGAVTASGLPYIADAALPTILQPAAAIPMTPGGLPFISDIGRILGDVIKAVPGAIETLANVLPSISTILGDGPAEIPQATIPTSPIILQAGQGTEPVAGQPIFFQTPSPANGSSNLALYALIGIAAYYFLR